MTDPPNDAELERILQEQVIPVLFGGATQSDPPQFLLLTGQSGAGAGRATGRLLREHPGSVPISAGDLAAFHPQASGLGWLGSADGRRDLANATNLWLQACLTYAREHARSVVLEGSFRQPNAAMRAIEQFAGAGYQTRVVAVGVRADASLLSVVSRHLRHHADGYPSRLDGVAEHHQTLFGTREIVAAAVEAASVGRVTVLDNRGEVVFDATRGEAAVEGAVGALRSAQTARLSTLESAQWLSELRRVTEYARERRLLPAVTEHLVSLHELGLRAVVPQLPVPEGSEVVRIQTARLTTQLESLRAVSARPVQPDVAAPVVAPDAPSRAGRSL